MTVRNFKYYLHNDMSSSEFCEIVLEDQLGMVPQDETDHERLDELMQKIGRPFYEVELDCTLDDETGAVEIVAVNGRGVS